MRKIELTLNKLLIGQLCSDCCHESNDGLWSSIW